MVLVVIGPVTSDLIVIGKDKFHKIGGATYYQSLVFEKYFNDYLAIVNCADEDLVNDFPTKDKVKVILKDDTHFFINDYPNPDNLDVRRQSSNFANIPILKGDLEEILPSQIDGFVINPLNRYDFPPETIEYLKSFGVPVFMSIQGFLRVPDDEVNGNYEIGLSYFDDLDAILESVTSIFMDETEANIIGTDFDVDEIVVTDGSHGSRIVTDDDEIKIEAVKCENVVDTTGCGDTYMAAYISQRIVSKSIKQSGDFASLIASRKISNFY